VDAGFVSSATLTILVLEAKMKDDIMVRNSFRYFLGRYQSWNIERDLNGAQN